MVFAGSGAVLLRTGGLGFPAFESSALGGALGAPEAAVPRESQTRAPLLGLWGAWAGSLLAECSRLELLESPRSRSEPSAAPLGPGPWAATAAGSLGEVAGTAALPSQETGLRLSHRLTLGSLAPWELWGGLSGGEKCGGGAGFLTFFPGSSRTIGRYVGVLEGLGEGDAKGGFGGAYPF